MKALVLKLFTINQKKKDKKEKDTNWLTWWWDCNWKII